MEFKVVPVVFTLTDNLTPAIKELLSYLRRKSIRVCRRLKTVAEITLTKSNLN